MAPNRTTWGDHVRVAAVVAVALACVALLALLEVIAE